jgi:hypothetical protein
MSNDIRQRALKALHLYRQRIVGAELAARLKTSPEGAEHLAETGRLIEQAEASRLTKGQRDVLKVICRVMARNMMLGAADAKITDVDRTAGKRTGWCGKQVMGLTIAGLVVSTNPGRFRLTNAGWAFAWGTGLIKPTWKVPT